MKEIDRSKKLAVELEQTELDFILAEINTGMTLAQTARFEYESGQKDEAERLRQKAMRAYLEAMRRVHDMHTGQADTKPLSDGVRSLGALLDELAKKPR